MREPEALTADELRARHDAPAAASAAPARADDGGPADPDERHRALLACDPDELSASQIIELGLRAAHDNPSPANLQPFVRAATAFLGPASTAARIIPEAPAIDVREPGPAFDPASFEVPASDPAPNLLGDGSAAEGAALLAAGDPRPSDADRAAARDAAAARATQDASASL